MSIRYWWEVGVDNVCNKPDSNGKWYPYVKGGAFNKWYGNNWTVINWEDNGHEIRDFRNGTGKLKSRPQNLSFYFKKGITYTLNGSKGASFRLLEGFSIFDVQSPSVFVKNNKDLNYAIASLNSSLLFYILGCLNPTVNTTPGDIKRIPFVQPPEALIIPISFLSKTNVNIKMTLSSFSSVELNYTFNPIVFFKKIADIKLNVKFYFNYENYLLTQVLLNEVIINEKIFEVYDLTNHDKAIVIAKEGESIGGLSISAEARTAYLVEEAAKEFPLDNIQDFINALPVKEFTAEAKEAIEAEFPSLYQSNNDLEEFCIRHKINPINVWYWFKQSNVM